MTGRAELAHHITLLRQAAAEDLRELLDDLIDTAYPRPQTQLPATPRRALVIPEVLGDTPPEIILIQQIMATSGCLQIYEYLYRTARCQDQ